jgi:hypothetical protein
MFEPLRVGRVAVEARLPPQAVVGALGRKVSHRPGVQRLLQHGERRALWDTCRMPIRLRCRLVSLDRQSGAQSVLVTASERHLVVVLGLELWARRNRPAWAAARRKARGSGAARWAVGLECSWRMGGGDVGWLVGFRWLGVVA